MKIKFKKLSENATMPNKGRAGDACFDLYAAEDVFVTDNRPRIIKTDIAMEIPEGYFGKIYTRSGMAKNGWQTAGWVIDSNYRGWIWVIIKYDLDIYTDLLELDDTTLAGVKIKKWDRIAQLAIHKVEDVTLEEVDELSDTVRWDAGYGSSGK